MHIMSQTGKDLGRLYLDLLCLLSKITLISFCLIPCSHLVNQFQFHKAASFPCLFKPHLTSLSDIVICFTCPSFLQKYIATLVAKLLSSCPGLPIEALDFSIVYLRKEMLGNSYISEYENYPEFIRSQHHEIKKLKQF